MGRLPSTPTPPIPPCAQVLTACGSWVGLLKEVSEKLGEPKFSWASKFKDELSESQTKIAQYVDSLTDLNKDIPANQAVLPSNPSPRPSLLFSTRPRSKADLELEQETTINEVTEYIESGIKENISTADSMLQSKGKRTPWVSLLPLPFASSSSPLPPRKWPKMPTLPSEAKKLHAEAAKKHADQQAAAKESDDGSEAASAAGQ